MNAIRRRKRIITFLLACAIGFSAAGGTAKADYETKARISSGQENIVLRARQLTEIKWTPVYDRWKWGRDGVFRAGTTYTGLPYGQPVHTGYIGYDVSLEEFAAAVSDPASAFYSGYSQYNRTAPYYSIDCSAFVSYAWGLSQRQNTHGLSRVGERVWSSSINSLETGDCLNDAGSHAVLVGEVTRSASGSVISVEIMEATPNVTCVTRYGQGGSKSLEKLKTDYLDNGYVILRYPGRHSVDYAHSCAVPLDGEKCGKCGSHAGAYAGEWYSEAISFVTERGIFVGTGKGFSPNENMTRGMFITVLGRFAGLSDDLGGRIGISLGDDVNLRRGPGKGYAVIGQADYGEAFSVLGWENGWYKVRLRGTVGYIDERYVKAYNGELSDVYESEYFSPYAQWAYLAGLTKGTGDGKFSPYHDITREDMAYLMYAYVRMSGRSLDQSLSAAGFADESAISAGKLSAVYALQRAGVINGVGDGYFRPRGSATRAQVAQMFMKLSEAV